MKATKKTPLALAALVATMAIPARAATDAERIRLLEE